MRLTRLVLLLFVLSLCTQTYSSLRYFQPSLLRLSDYYTTTTTINFIKRNLLFRGGSPASRDFKSFNTSGLFNKMTILSKYNGIEFPDDFWLIDISLLDDSKSDDHLVLNIEKDYFRLKTISGLFINYPIIGDEHSPSHTHNITLKYEYAKVYDKRSRDKLPDFVQLIRKLLKSNFDKPLVIYIHCMHGVDRTGEVIGAYQMKYLNYSLDRVIYEDTQINNGILSPKKHNMNSIEWYNLYLEVNRKL